MENEQSQLNPNQLEHLLTTYVKSEYLLAGTAFAYIVGFIIVNLYLGSLGASSLGLLRARYIVVGAAFLLYSASVTIALHGLIHVVRAAQSKFDFVWRVLAYSSFVYGFYVLWSGALSPTSTPGAIAFFPRPLTGYANAALTLLFVQAIVYASIVAPGLRLSRSAWRKREIWEDLSLVLLLEGAWLLSWRELKPLFSPNIQYDVVTLNVATGVIPFGLRRYVDSAVALYVVLGSTFVADAMSFKFYNQRNESPGPRFLGQAVLLSRAHALVVAMALFLPIWVTTVYPALPRHLGGGALNRIRLSGPDLTSELGWSHENLFLVDYTDTGPLVLAANEYGKTQRLVEIRDHLIGAVEYVLPTPSVITGTLVIPLSVTATTNASTTISSATP